MEQWSGVSEELQKLQSRGPCQVGLPDGMRSGRSRTGVTPLYICGFFAFCSPDLHWSPSLISPNRSSITVLFQICYVYTPHFQLTHSVLGTLDGITMRLQRTKENLAPTQTKKRTTPPPLIHYEKNGELTVPLATRNISCVSTSAPHTQALRMLRQVPERSTRYSRGPEPVVPFPRFPPAWSMILWGTSGLRVLRQRT
jgi:hypothetical protein